MLSSFPIHFKKVQKSDKQTILNWFDQNHVKEFYYGDGLQNTLNNIQLYCQGINNNGLYTFDHWIAYYDEEPFGFLMTSLITGPYHPNDPYNKWYQSDKKTYTLDLLIGNETFLGKGLADKMIRAFILDNCVDADFFLIDPEISNAKAIHVYEKAGFEKVDQIIPEFNPKPHMMMRLSVANLKNT